MQRSDIILARCRSDKGFAIQMAPSCSFRP